MSSRERFFEIDDPRAVPTIIKAIPPGWTHIDGQLNAPSKLLEQGRVAENTAFSLNVYHPELLIAGTSNKGVARLQPDLEAILFDQKLPQIVRFMGVIQNTSEQVRRILTRYLDHGYLGVVTFYKNDCRIEKYNQTSCRITAKSADKVSIGDRIELYPSHIQVLWGNQDTDEDVLPIIRACQQVKFSEYSMESRSEMLRAQDQP